MTRTSKYLCLASPAVPSASIPPYLFCTPKHHAYNIPILNPKRQPNAAKNATMMGVGRGISGLLFHNTYPLAMYVHTDLHGSFARYRPS